MKKTVFLIFWVMLPLLAFGQYKYNRELFSHNMSLENIRNIIPFGDQNGDGYDDILVRNCSEGNIYLFYGGAPMDTLPALVWKSPPQKKIIYFTAVDINHDKIPDLLIQYVDTTVGGGSKKELLGFYGGKTIDTIPDFSIPAPAGANPIYWGYPAMAIPDFDGDGYEDLMIPDFGTPYHPKIYNGTFYFYSTNPVLDTIPKMAIGGDTAQAGRHVTYSGNGITFGDINGDGKTDIWYLSYNLDSLNYMRNIEGHVVLGNSTWDSTSSQIIYQNGHNYYLPIMYLLGDINGDGRTDFILENYNGYFPYYYDRCLIYGKFPVDTIPNAGLNTQYQGSNIEKYMGDINHDGYGDFVTNNGSIYPVAKVWLGSNDMTKHDLPVAYIGGTDNCYGGMIAPVGDVNGDGVNDFAVGTTTLGTTCMDGYFVIISGDTTGLTEIKSGHKSTGFGYKLYEAYPNPFNPGTTISYELGETGRVTLKVYDILGREVQTLVDEIKNAGKYEAAFDASRLTTGVYIAQLQVEQNSRVLFRQEKKLSFIK